MPQNERNPRTVRPNGEEIRRVRLEKGMRREDLAAAAECSRRTIDSVEASLRVNVATLKRVADALGVECVRLIVADDPNPDPETSSRRPRGRAKVGLEKEFADFDATQDVDALVASLAKLLKTRCKIYVIAVDPGSVILTLDMDNRDLVRLVVAFGRGQLRALNVSWIEVPRPALASAVTRAFPAWLANPLRLVRRHVLLTLLFATSLALAAVFLFPTQATILIVVAVSIYVMVNLLAQFGPLGTTADWVPDADVVLLEDRTMKNAKPSTSDILAAARAHRGTLHPLPPTNVPVKSPEKPTKDSPGNP